LKSELDRIWDEKRIPILDIDVVGALNIKEKYGDKALAIFVHPISLENLHHRLTRRATETVESFQKRISRAEQEMEYADRFDKIVYNDTIEHALVKTEEYVYDYLLKDKKLLL
jgi:guanylate kinase